MLKLIIPFGLYWHNLLDIILTHVFTIAFLYNGHPLIASLLISTDSLLKVSVSILLSRLAARLSPWIRGRASAAIKLSLVFLFFYAINKVSLNNMPISLMTFIPFILFKLFLMTDSSMSAEFIFLLRNYFNVDLAQSAAAQNIFVRGSTAVAPAAALILLTWPHTNIIIFFSALLVAIFSFSFYKKLYFAQTETLHANHRSLQPISLTHLLKVSLIRWGFAYQVLGNLAFAGVAFLLLALLKPQSHIFINEITFLYSAFLLGQLFILIFGEQVIPIKTTFGIGLTMGLCGFFVFITGLTHPSLISLMACVGIGLTYSASLSAIQVVLTAKIQGPGYIEFLGWSQTLGRLMSFSIIALLGFVIHAGYSPQHLLISCGLLGLIAATILMFMRVNESELLQLINTH